MSHFSVLVVGTNIEDKLAPYDENLIVDRYVYRTKPQVIEEEKKDIESIKVNYVKYLENPAKYQEECTNPSHIDFLINEFPKRLNWNDEDLYQHGIKYEEQEDIGPNGEIYRITNPRGYWDWWEIGGRYSGFFIKKSEKSLIKTNQATKHEIDLKNLGGENKSNSELRKEFDLFRSDKAEHQFYNGKYYLKRYKTARNYVKQRINQCTFAVITEEGDWVSPGEMGWFGVSSNSPEAMFEWHEHYHSRFLSPLSDDTLLTIVDCHI